MISIRALQHPQGRRTKPTPAGYPLLSLLFMSAHLSFSLCSRNLSSPPPCFLSPIPCPSLEFISNDENKTQHAQEACEGWVPRLNCPACKRSACLLLARGSVSHVAHQTIKISTLPMERVSLFLPTPSARCRLYRSYTVDTKQHLCGIEKAG